MKKITLIIFIFSLFLNINAQQSKLGKIRPKNVNIGIVYNKLNKSQTLISNVPTYIWHKGCGPTALGMVIGYYDEMGFDDLINGSASSQTEEVNNAIANQEHYDDYSLPLDYYPDLFQDKSDLGGAHTANCIADFMETSWSSKNNRYGWTFSNKIDDAFTNYINMQNPNYQTITSYDYFGTSSWDNYKLEIDNNKPVVLLVDSDGDGSTDHFVTGIGYDEDNLMYGIYDTWDNNIHWYEWRGRASGNNWGIYGFNILHISTPISISSKIKEKIKIYPIPSKDIINIEIPLYQNSQGILISLFNTLGKKVLSKQISHQTKKIRLDISNIKNGTYLIKLSQSNNILKTEKIIILK